MHIFCSLSPPPDVEREFSHCIIKWPEILSSVRSFRDTGETSQWWGRFSLKYICWSYQLRRRDHFRKLDKGIVRIIESYQEGVWASQVALVVKNPPANAGDIRDLGLIPGSGIRRAWQPTPVSLPGESHGHRSQEGYSLWGHTESDMTEAT